MILVAIHRKFIFVILLIAHSSEKEEKSREVIFLGYENRPNLNISVRDHLSQASNSISKKSNKEIVKDNEGRQNGKNVKMIFIKV